MIIATVICKHRYAIGDINTEVMRDQFEIFHIYLTFSRRSLSLSLSSELCNNLCLVTTFILSEKPCSRYLSGMASLYIISLSLYMIFQQGAHSDTLTDDVP